MTEAVAAPNSPMNRCAAPFLRTVETTVEVLVVGPGAAASAIYMLRAPVVPGAASFDPPPSVQRQPHACLSPVPLPAAADLFGCVRKVTSRGGLESQGRLLLLPSLWWDGRSM